MEVSDCVATALTRARQARLPSPWTEAVDFLDLAARASKKVERWRAWLCGKQRKSTASGQGEGPGNGHRDGAKKSETLWLTFIFCVISDPSRCLNHERNRARQDQRARP